VVRSPVGANPRLSPVLPEAVRKLALSICAWKVLLNLANPETKSAGDGYPKKAIEKTVLCFLSSRTFSHGLAPYLPFAIPVGTGSVGWIPARRDLAAWLAKWSGKYPKLTGWVEENIDETLTFYRLPRQHHKHLKSTNMLERLNEEIKRRTQVVRIFPNGERCLRLVRALAVETHESWLEQHRYLNMDDLREHKKEALRRAA